MSTSALGRGSLSSTSHVAEGMLGALLDSASLQPPKLLHASQPSTFRNKHIAATISPASAQLVMAQPRFLGMTPCHEGDLNAFANVETAICATPPKAERMWILFAMPDDQVYSTTRRRQRGSLAQHGEDTEEAPSCVGRPTTGKEDSCLENIEICTIQIDRAWR